MTHEDPQTPASVPASNVVFDSTSSPPGQGFAVTSLVLGCCSIALFWLWAIPPILAIVFGSIAIFKARGAGRKPSGMAVAGLVLGIVFTALFALVIIMYAAS